MAACPEYDELLTLHAAGALDAEAEARVRAHLESCAGCRAEAASTETVLGQLAPPAPSAREAALLEALPRRTLAVWRREQVRTAARMQWTGALLAAAAAVLVVLAPSLRHRPHVPATVPAAAPASAPVSDDTVAAFDAWATGDPLSDALASGDTDDADGLFAPDSFISGDEGWDSEMGEL